MVKTLATAVFRLALLFVFVYVVVLFVMVRPPLSVQGAHLNYARVVDPKPLEHHVTQLTESFSPRDAKNPDNLDLTAVYISEQFRQFGIPVKEQVYQVPEEPTQAMFKNIIATLGPETEEIIVIGAHYDSVEGSIGADDNASGVAGLIELARLLSKVQLTTQVQLVAFTLEEPPFFNTEHMGSEVFAKSLAEAGKDVRLMICLEMIGYFSDEPHSQQFPFAWMSLFYPTKGNFIAIVDQLMSNESQKMKKVMNRVMSIEAYSVNAPKSFPGVTFSDHRSFWAYDYPAVMVTDTAFYRNPHYHKPGDTLDTLDFDKMAEVVYGVYRYVYFLANQPDSESFDEWMEEVKDGAEDVTEWLGVGD